MTLLEQIEQFKRDRDLIEKRLVKQQSHRKEHDEFVPDPLDGYENPEWVLLERQVVFDVVNELRAGRNLPSVDIKEILRCERTACGHIDYTRKYILYAAEVVRDGKLGPVY